MAATYLISSHYRLCHNDFSRLVSTTEMDHRFREQITTDQVQNEFDRFRLWAGNVGAAHMGSNYNISLDYRLREAPFYKDQVIKVMGKLDDFLRRGLTLLEGKSRPFEELSSSEYSDETSDSDSESDASISEVKPAILSQEQLDAKTTLASLRASAAGIPRLPDPTESPPTIPILAPTQTDVGQIEAGHSNDNQQVTRDEWANQEAPSQMEARIGEVPQLIESIHFMITSLFKMPIRRPAIHEQSRKATSVDVSHFEEFDARYIRDRFPDANADLAERLLKNTLRRRQILQYRAQHYDNIKPVIPEQEYDNEASEKPSAGPTLITKGTTWRPENSSQTLPELSVAETIQTAMSSNASSWTGAQKLSLPPRPKGLPGSGEFLCPYCFVVSYIKTNSSWRHHVFKDLEPYFCTYASCSEKDRRFVNRDDWYEHEIQNHRVEWSCNVEGHQSFDTSCQFLQHIKAEHSSMLPSVQSPETLGMFQRPASNASIMARKCPFCDKVSKKPKLHIARHMEQIALYVLGGSNQEDQEQYERSSIADSEEAELSTWDGSVGSRSLFGGSTDSGEEGDNEGISSPAETARGRRENPTERDERLKQQAIMETLADEKVYDEQSFMAAVAVRQRKQREDMDLTDEDEEEINITIRETSPLQRIRSAEALASEMRKPAESSRLKSVDHGPTRYHRKERIVIVDSPPTPRAPQLQPVLPFKPIPLISRPPREHERIRPTIADDRRLTTERRDDKGTSAVGSSDIEYNAARERRFREQNEEIRQRPVLPLVPAHLRPSASGRDGIQQPETQATIDLAIDRTKLNEATRFRDQTLERLTEQKKLGKIISKEDLSVLDEANHGVTLAEAEIREEKQLLEKRARLSEAEEEAMRQRLLERQMPRRRFSVGPGVRRHRVLYDDDVYRWE